MIDEEAFPQEFEDKTAVAVSKLIKSLEASTKGTIHAPHY
jgi:hypothetical protein